MASDELPPETPRPPIRRDRSASPIGNAMPPVGLPLVGAALLLNACTAAQIADLIKIESTAGPRPSPIGNAIRPSSLPASPIANPIVPLPSKSPEPSTGPIWHPPIGNTIAPFSPHPTQTPEWPPIGNTMAPMTPTPYPVPIGNTMPPLRPTPTPLPSSLVPIGNTMAPMSPTPTPVPSFHIPIGNTMVPLATPTPTATPTPYPGPTN